MLANVTVKAAYQGDGANKSFAIPFQDIVSDVSEVQVYTRDESVPASPVVLLRTYGALQDYTLTGAVPPTTPFNTTVLFNSAPTATQKVIIYRTLPLTQILNLLTAGTFDFANINTALDRIVAMIQQLNEMFTRVPIMNITTQAGQITMPDPVASTVLGFDANKNLTLYPTASTPVLVTAETQATLADNTSGQSLGLTVDANTWRTMVLAYSVVRTSSNGTLREAGKIVLTYDDSAGVWLIDNPTDGGKMSGVTFAVSTSSGVATVTATTDSFSLGGTGHSGKIRYKGIYALQKET